MKKIFLIMLAFGVNVAVGQVQPKDLPEATSLSDADIMITQQEDNKVRKFDFQFFKDQILFWNESGNYIYTLDSLGIGTASPTELMEVNGNLKVDTIKGSVQIKGDNNILAYYNSDSILTPLPELGYDGSILEVDTDALFYTSVDFLDTVSIYHLQATSGDHEAHIGRFSRLDTLDYATANTWETIKIDTSMVNRTTTGFELTADSLGIKINFTGIIAITSSAHVRNNGIAAKATLYWRTLINGVEVSCQNTTTSLSFNGGAVIDLNSMYSSNIVSNGDTISFQYRATDTDFDIAVYNDGVFDREIPVSIFLKQLINKK